MMSTRYASWQCYGVMANLLTYSKYSTASNVRLPDSGDRLVQSHGLMLCTVVSFQDAEMTYSMSVAEPSFAPLCLVYLTGSCATVLMPVQKQHKA